MTNLWRVLLTGRLAAAGGGGARLCQRHAVVAPLVAANINIRHIHDYYSCVHVGA